MEEEICRLYIEDNKTLKELSKLYELSSYRIRNIITNNGFSIRSRSEVKKLNDIECRGKIGYNGRKYSINHSYFKTFSSNMAYILGMIATDGNVFGSKITIVLKRSDRELLEKIKEELSFNGEIRDEIKILNNKKYESSWLVFCSEEMVEDLRKFNIKENKSLTLKSPMEFIPLSFWSDFIRGVFDGDGSVGCQYPTNSNKVKTKTCQIRTRFFSSSYDFMKDLGSMLEVLLDLKEPPKISTHSKSRINDFYSIEFSTAKSISLYNILYTKDSIFLNRKKESFDSYIEARIKDISITNGNIKVKSI